MFTEFLSYSVDQRQYFGQQTPARNCDPLSSRDAAAARNPDGVDPHLVGGGDQREDGLPLSRPREDRPADVLSDRGVSLRPRAQVLWSRFQQDDEA